MFISPLTEEMSIQFESFKELKVQPFPYGSLYTIALKQELLEGPIMDSSLIWLLIIRGQT